MKKDELIELLQRQNSFLNGKLEKALISVRSLTSANEKLTATVEELRRQTASLEETLKGKNIEFSKEKTARQAMRRLQESPSERQTMGNKMLDCFDDFPKEMQDTYSFLLDYKELLVELRVVVDAVKYIEIICKTEGFSLANSKKCKKYIMQHVIGNANNRRAMIGIKILEYLKLQEEKLNGTYEVRNISSDIIESTFGVFKQKNRQTNFMV